MKRLITLVLAFLVGSLSVPIQTAPTAAADSTFAGWAIDAYPSLSSADFLAALTRLRDNGANYVWLGHCNPAAVDPNADEVGLCYPVYAASLNSRDPNNAAANAILAAQHRFLDAARAVGLKVVLPINYRTQMGDAWNQGHNGSLRRGPDGTVLNFGGVDASPYASDFRADLTQYYRWVDQTFVGPYRDVILLVSLGDEPTGVDYSAAANAAFAQEYGIHFADVGSDPVRTQELGAFQTHVMIDFATWAAQQWQWIDPAVTLTLSFSSSPGRKSYQAPLIEDIFRQTPGNLQPAFDTDLRDGAPTEALDDSDVTELTLFVGTVSHFAARYGRSFWLWSAGNSWGLGGGSPDPSSIADAIVNLHLVADVAREAGGPLRGIAVWSYNVRGQGLYNDSYHPPYNPDDLFKRVSAELPVIRQILSGPAGAGPTILVLAPNAMPERLLGQNRVTDIWAFRGYNFGDLVSLARTGATMAVVNTLSGEDLTALHLIVVLARGPGDLTDGDVAALRAYQGAGHSIVDAASLDGPLSLGAAWVAPGNAAEQLFSEDYTKTSVGPVSDLGFPRLTNSFAIVGPSETLAYGGAATSPNTPWQAWLNLAAPTLGTIIAPSGVPAGSLVAGPGLTSVSTQRHAVVRLAGSAQTPVVATANQYFPETGFRVDDSRIWDYFVHRGGINTFGYPVSRTFTFEGFQVQFFQRRIIQIDQNGNPRLLNLLDGGLMPYASFNGATFPGIDDGLVASAPPPGDARDVLSFVQQNAPDAFAGLSVHFNQTFLTTVSLAVAFPHGGDPALLPGFDLEMWGVPTSRPALDPSNHNFAYLRFQRGILMYDANCGCTQGILLADYLKSILTGQNLPADLEQEARSSPFYHQYDPSQRGWVHNPSLLPNTDLTNAFTSESP